MFFSRAALEFMIVTGRQPDVLHLHDWQSSTVVSGVGQQLGTTEGLMA
jgi:starch synthase